MPRIHEIKCLPKYFKETERGLKNFELRLNDRDYRVGDLLAMNEYDGKAYTGRSMLLRVDYIMDPNAVMTCRGGYVLMGTHRLNVYDDTVSVKRRE